MNVLVIGSGGREHSLVWKLSQSAQVTKIYCCPGNAGISQYAECLDVPDEVYASLLDFSLDKNIDLVVVGPEQPLVDGLVDTFEQAGLLVFGPSQKAAQLEGSKIFAKEFMGRHNIPTAPFKVFDDSRQAIAYIQSSEGPWVVKADGLAAGKGVIICHSKKEAESAIHDMMEKERFGTAGKKVLIEKYLEGEEGSFLVVTDGKSYVPLASAQDHKAAFDGDNGPNTGGMGAYSPAPLLEGEMRDKIITRIIEPAVAGMAKEGTPFKGVLYAGLMIVDHQPYVLEFNARFGDPETQPILLRIKNDLFPLLYAAAKGDLSNIELEWDDRAAMLVVMASCGYPGKYLKGKTITGLKEASSDPNVMVFHAGTRRKDGEFITSGGRVLGVTALGKDLQAARDIAYTAVNKIHFDEAHYRKDIGARALGGLK